MGLQMSIHSLLYWWQLLVAGSPVLPLLMDYISLLHKPLGRILDLRQTFLDPGDVREAFIQVLNLYSIIRL
jgi:hypothetical protein